MLASSYRPAVADTEEVAFGSRPTPSCRLSLICSLQMFPRPQVGGRAYFYIGSHGAGGDAIRLLPITMPAHSLRSFAIGTMPACQRNGWRDGINETRKIRTNDGTGDGTIEWNARRYKKSGRVAVIRPPCPLACLLACLPISFCVPASAIVRRFRNCELLGIEMSSF